MYIYYQQSYEAPERQKRIRQARAKRIIQRASRLRRQRRRRRAYLGAILQRPRAGGVTFMGHGPSHRRLRLGSDPSRNRHGSRIWYYGVKNPVTV